MANKSSGYLRTLIFSMILATGSMVSNGQSTDTVWVNTLNFDDITKRSGSFQFPEKQTWQKVLMHYTLKCDPRTTQDNFPCGEWDYLSYINVLDSTGIMDSAQVDQSNFMIGDDSPDSFLYVNNPFYDTLQSWQYETVVDQVFSNDSAKLGSGLSSTTSAFSNSRTQYLFTANELNAAGLSAGLITGISFQVIQPAGTAKGVTIRIAATPKQMLDKYQEGSFSTVFEGDLSINTLGLLKLENLEPFQWDGASSLIVEIVLDKNSSSTLPEIASDISSNGIYSEPGNVLYAPQSNSFLEVNDADKLFSNTDSLITVAFWLKGDNSLPFNNSVLEAKNDAGNRVFNIHMPWSNGQIYWDCGNDGNQYDRINKPVAENVYKNTWNHWAFVKNSKTGDLSIYLNGILWHSGTDNFRSMSGISKFRIGKAISNNQYRGQLDRLSVWNNALSKTEIEEIMLSPIKKSHARYSDLLLQLEFDNYNPLKPGVLQSVHDTSVQVKVFGEANIQYASGMDSRSDFKPIAQRPQTIFYQADQLTHQDSSLRWSTRAHPLVIAQLFEDPDSVALQSGYSYGYRAGMSYTFDPAGQKIDSTEIKSTQRLDKQIRSWFRHFEVVRNVEIGRYITPYGIGFDLGPNGFKWIYDVTDYAHLLADNVTLSAGNQQELIDLRFEFIPGTPPRELKQIDYYVNRESRSYRNIADDVNFKAQEFDLHPDAKTFKLVTRITGHGHAPSLDVAHCCEWSDKKHYIKIDGKDALEWDIWQDDKCALNPLNDQGGNWAPPRAGWCPGAPVDDYNFEITSTISGNKVNLDYEIEPVPTNNLGQGGGNYVVSLHLMEYGNWLNQNDASVTGIVQPNNWEFYKRMNPTCAKPTIIVQNTGANTINSILLKYGVIGGNPIEYEWKGEVKSDKSEQIELPFAIWDYLSPENNQTFFAEIVKVNGKKDEYAGNNRATSNFDIPDVVPTTVDLWFRNNSIPDATVKITNDAGVVVYSKEDAGAAELVKEVITLNPGCYTLECVTENGYGLYYPLAPSVGSGLLRMTNISAGYVKNFNPDFGKSIEYHFTVAYPLHKNDILQSDEKWRISPNPSNGLIIVESTSNSLEPYNLKVTNTMGQQVYQMDGVSDIGLVQVDLRHLSTGIYYFQFSQSGLSQTQKVVIR